MRHRYTTPNAFYIDGDTTYLALTSNDGVIAEAIIDTEDLPRVLAAGRWCAQWSPDIRQFYVILATRSGDKFGQLLHRFLMAPPPDMVVDHKNRITLDCRKSNLRICTTAQNMQNRSGAHKNSKSGVRGVHWDKRARKWRALVKAGGKTHCVGWFADINEADVAVRAARQRLHGEFSN